MRTLNILKMKQAVQQSKIGRKRKANMALNPKRSEIFCVKSNCGTASKEEKKRIKKGRRIGIALTAILILLFWLALTTSISGATAVNVTPTTQEVLAGENFSVNITIENVTNMRSDQAILNFDPSAMNAMEIIEGDFLNSSGSTLPVEKINNTEGTAGFAYALLPGGTPLTGSGVLATIKFNTDEEAEGTFDLNLTDVMIKNETAEVPVSVYNGTVKILAPSPTATGGDASSGGGGGGEAPTDTDGDGLSDFDEMWKYKTDHKKADTDGGGIDDGAEIIRGTDPLDPTDDIGSTPAPSPSPQVAPTLSPAVTPPPAPSPSPTSTPTPPGFEAFFAIAGLLAVAYLVMRRRKA